MASARALRLALGALIAFGLSLAAWAQAGPVLHEYFEVDLEEDLKLGATTRDGTFPAALETESGIVPAPQPSRNSTPNTTTYGGLSTPNSADSTYRIDRNTTRPSLVSYDDPFTPPITPFKRLYAYDAVDEGLELFVSDKTLTKMHIGGQASAGEDQFYGDLFVDLAENSPVRIPSVGPHARVLRAQLEPPTQFEILQDGAENWFIRSNKRMRARLMMQLSVPRAVFGSRFADVSWSKLERHLVSLPAPLQREASAVLAELGLSKGMQPREALVKLVDYFRSFKPSEQLPEARSGTALYAELTLSQMGVCRHRGYAFVITALRLGLPSRFVRNEAHAWVEVYDGELWHRIDLGGAAGQLQSEQDTRVAPHRPPSDPFAWPEGSESALDMASGAQTSNTQDASGSDGPSGSQGGDVTRQGSTTQHNTPEPQTTPQTASTASEPENEKDPDDRRPATTLDFRLSSDSARRGMPLQITGTALTGDDPCAYARVDVLLRPKNGDPVAIGSLPTNERGQFTGAVTVPLGIEVGHYELTLSTPGTARCGPSGD